MARSCESVATWGWHEQFEPAGTCKSPPPGEPIHIKQSRWHAYGKDQPDHAFARRPMRLYEVVKSVAVLADAMAQTGRTVTLAPSRDGKKHLAGQLSLHPALFTVGGFTVAYYKEHLECDNKRLLKLFKHCGLWSTLNGTVVPTFKEMSEGMSASHRTCAALIAFCEAENLPHLGEIQADSSSRGTNRTHRRNVKKETRIGAFEPYSADCVIEIFGS
jgi:hypothetical protein